MLKLFPEIAAVKSIQFSSDPQTKDDLVKEREAAESLPELGGGVPVLLVDGLGQHHLRGGQLVSWDDW